MNLASSSFTVSDAARQVGRSPATVRAWIARGRLRVTPDTTPIRLDRDPVLEARARHLARFDAVQDLQRHDAAPETEAARLRFLLRTVLSSVETFDEGVSQLRRSQRSLLDSLLQEMGDTAAPPLP